MSFKIFVQSVTKILFLYVILLLSFFISRIAILYAYSSAAELQDYHKDLVKAFITGFRFDTVVFTYSFLALFIVACIPIKHDRYRIFFRKFLIWYSSIALFFLLWIQIVDFYFFKFFQSHLSLLAFGIIYDDTRAVLESVWTDYPITWILLGFSLVFVLLVWVLIKISRKDIPGKVNFTLWQRILFATVVLLLYGLGLRGSLGIFPIQKDDATISPNGFVNNLTMNGVFALKDAYADNKSSKIDTDTLLILKKYGFKSRNEALECYTGAKLHSRFISDELVDTTRYNEFLEKNPPNVLFILMESMAGYYFDLHSKELNLLGTLEQELPYCYLFRNFTSCSNGTVHTLEGLMVNSPLTPLSQSRYMNKPLPFSVAKVFADNGYRTSFLTGAKLGWRNLGRYVSGQYFQEVEGSSHLLAEFTGSKSCEWGVYDEYLFERIFQQLSESKGKPLFVFAFTTSNHTPYQLPEKYVPQSIIIPEYLKNKQRSDNEIMIKNFTAYQYANNCLGRLIYRIRNSEFGKNTIVIATGDHNIMSSYNSSDRRLLKKYGVPLIMYIPDAYKPSFVDTKRFGSHKDIFPTVFNMSLSDAAYIKSGNNLFGDTSDEQYFAVNNYNTAFNKTGGVVFAKKSLYYKFGRNNELVTTTLHDTPDLGKLEKISRAHGAVLSFFIQEQISR